MSKFFSLCAALSVALVQSGCASTDGDNSGMQLFQQVVGIASMAVGTATRNDNLANQGQELLNQSFNQTTTTPAVTPVSSPAPTPTPAAANSGQVYAANGNQIVFNMKSNHPNRVQVSFYSQTRPGFSWPGGGQAYDLNDSASHAYTLNCNAGEKVCYGAWVTGSGSRYWGVGPRMSKSCSNCCGTCGGTYSYNLNP
jgi:hypothetical protein